MFVVYRNEALGGVSFARREKFYLFRAALLRHDRQAQSEDGKSFERQQHDERGGAGQTLSRR